jgi:transcriptional regulator with XRE-family HTH domain
MTDEILRLAHKRKTAGIHQATIAKIIGVSNSTISDIETLKIGVDQETFNRLSEAIDALVSQSASGLSVAPSH